MKFLPRTIRQLAARNDNGAIRQLAAGKGEHVTVNGWVTAIRNQKSIVFLNINDGTLLEGIQAVLEQTSVPNVSIGTSVQIDGKLMESENRKQKFELHASNIKILGAAIDYPLSKARMPFPWLRENMNIRSRTRTFQAIWKIRSCVYDAINSYFKNDFMRITTPIITANDCEGGGEAFRIHPIDGKEFFKKPAYLTVSGQLHAECLASSIARVYTLGPTFRAEKQESNRHLTEFWMLEAEISFITDLSVLMDLIEDFVQHLVRSVLENTSEIDFFNEFIEKGLKNKLNSCLEPFKRISYSEAVDMLKAKKFHTEIHWGHALTGEHEKYLASKLGPVFITDYPENVKPFYMKPNGDGTVACMDLILPGIGELVGGSLREDDYNQLRSKMLEMGLLNSDLEWYLNLRKFGSVPHGGFGLGIERFLLFVTGMTNIKDVIPMPRSWENCQM